jgi:hypothetical protein
LKRAKIDAVQCVSSLQPPIDDGNKRSCVFVALQQSQASFTMVVDDDDGRFERNRVLQLAMLAELAMPSGAPRRWILWVRVTNRVARWCPTPANPWSRKWKFAGVLARLKRQPSSNFLA